MKVPLIILFVALATIQNALAVEPADYSVRFGVIEADIQSGASSLRETTTIPLKLRDTGFRWGFSISPGDRSPFTYQYTIHLPSPPAMLSGDLQKLNPEKPSNTAMSEKVESKGGPTMHTMWFDPGDPTGNYKIEVFVNGRLQQTASFTVFAR